MPIVERPLNRIDEMRRCLEPEGDGIADVQVADFLAGGLDPLRFDNDVTNRVGESGEAGGDGNWRGGFCGRHEPSYREFAGVILTWQGTCPNRQSV